MSSIANDQAAGADRGQDGDPVAHPLHDRNWWYADGYPARDETWRAALGKNCAGAPGLIRVQGDAHNGRAGTGVQIAPVTSVDRVQIGDGQMGRISIELQRLYFEVVKGRNPKYLDWLTPVKSGQPAERAESGGS